VSVSERETERRVDSLKETYSLAKLRGFRWVLELPGVDVACDAVSQAGYTVFAFWPIMIENRLGHPPEQPCILFIGRRFESPLLILV